MVDPAPRAEADSAKPADSSQELSSHAFDSGASVFRIDGRVGRLLSSGVVSFATLAGPVACGSSAQPETPGEPASESMPQVSMDSVDVQKLTYERLQIDARNGDLEASAREILTAVSRAAQIPLQEYQVEEPGSSGDLPSNYADQPVSSNDNPAVDLDIRIALPAGERSLPATLDIICAALSQEGEKEVTWQVSKSGALQVAPKELFNAQAVSRTYVLDNGKGDPLKAKFEAAEPLNMEALRRREFVRRASQNLSTNNLEAEGAAQMLASNIEPAQWRADSAAGQKEATVRELGGVFAGHYVVRAPEYIHRQIVALSRSRAGDESAERAQFALSQPLESFL